MLEIKEGKLGSQRNNCWVIRVRISVIYDLNW